MTSATENLSSNQGAVSISEAARLLSVRRETVHHWLNQGKIACVENGRRRLIALSTIEDLRGNPVKRSPALFRHGRPPAVERSDPTLAVPGVRDAEAVVNAFAQVGEHWLLLAGAAPGDVLLDLAEGLPLPVVLVLPSDQMATADRKRVCLVGNTTLGAPFGAAGPLRAFIREQLKWRAVALAEQQAAERRAAAAAAAATEPPAERQ